MPAFTASASRSITGFVRVNAMSIIYDTAATAPISYYIQVALDHLYFVDLDKMWMLDS